MTIIKHSIDAETADKAVAAAAKKAAELNLKMCIAVADESGDLKAFHRMDGAPKLSIQISQDKAFTAASFSMPTHAWFDFIDCGVLQQSGEEVRFKYDRFQDFFVAGFFRDNDDALKNAMEGRNWIASARELDLYTARFRHEARLLPIARGILESSPMPESALTRQSVCNYLREGPSALAAGVQLRKMRKERMTAAQVDEVLEKAERGSLGRARALRDETEQEKNEAPR